MAKKTPTASTDNLPPALPKSPTGIAGFDEVTEGGLPRGRPSLVCGGPGSGKTLFAMEFLVKGATQFMEQERVREEARAFDRSLQVEIRKADRPEEGAGSRRHIKKAA